MNVMSSDNNMHMMLDGNVSNSIERKLEIVLNPSPGQCDSEANPTYKIASQQTETRNLGCRFETTRSDGPLESMICYHGNCISGYPK